MEYEQRSRQWPQRALAARAGNGGHRRSGTAILRTRVYQDDCRPLSVDAQSYLYDVSAASDAPYVASPVSDPAGLRSDETGVVIMGLNPGSRFPRGDYGWSANFWRVRERDARAEPFTGAAGGI